MRLSSDHLQALGTLAAAIAALIALFVAWDQGRVMRADQHASVWPAVQIETAYMINEDGRQLTLGLVNDGIGPALIKHVSASVDGTRLNNWEDLIRLQPEGLPLPGRWTAGAQGEILAAGEDVVLAQLSWGEDPAILTALDEYRRTVGRMELNVCFCSVYDRCWISAIGSQQDFPQPVSQCPQSDQESNL